jgi:hypothetical protein
MFRPKGKVPIDDSLGNYSDVLRGGLRGPRQTKAANLQPTFMKTRSLRVSVGPMSVMSTSRP